MKKLKAGKRLYIKVAALVVGLIIWTIIINVEDADFSANINDVPVQISGELILRDSDLVVANKNDVADASISVRGKRSDVINYMDDIYAVADVSNITEPGEYNIRLSYESGTNTLYITERKTTTVKVVVEKLQKKEVEVIAIQQNSSDTSDRIIESEPELEKIVIRGTAVDIARVANAAVVVNVEGMMADSEQVLSVKLVDEQKKPLTFKNNIYKSEEETRVVSKVYKKKTVPVRVEVTGLPENSTFIVESLSADELDIGVADGIEVNEIKAVVVYAAEAADKYIAELISNEGVYIPKESMKAEVKIKIVPRVKKQLTVPLEIEAEAGKKIAAPSQINIDIMGAEEEITPGNVKAVVNASKLDAGVHKLPVTVKLKKPGLTVAVMPEITVTIE